VMAKGADVLVHEIMYVAAVEKYIKGEIAKGRPVQFEAIMAHMKADHTPSEDVGRIAQEAASKRWSYRISRRRSTASLTTPGANRWRNTSRARSSSEGT
jgi:ribonuclease BN (tRNA processing enzyme)